MSDDAPTQTLPTAPSPLAALPLSGFAAGITGAALVVAGVWGLHVLTPGGGAVGSVGWVVLLCLAFTALGKGVTLLRRALAPLTAAAVAPLAGISAPVRAAAGIVIGAAGIWWVMRGHAATWWTRTIGTGDASRWTLTSQLVAVAFMVVFGALLFGGAKTLATAIFANSGTRERSSQSANQQRWVLWWSSHPGLGLTLLAGGAALVFLSGYIVPRVAGWLTGDDPMAALAAIVLVLTVAFAANTWWWKALHGWWTWAHTHGSGGGGASPLGQMHAGAAVIALIWFSAMGFGLATPADYTGPGAAPLAHAQCPPDCGGGNNGGGSYGPNASQFQPPQMPAQQPDYQGGINQPPLDQNSGISIYNQNPGQGGQSGPQQAGQNIGQQTGQRAAHGTPLPDYGPWQPDAQPPAQPAQGPAVQQAPVQQAPVQQPAQAPQPVQQAPAQQIPQAPQQPAQAPEPAQQAPVQQAPAQQAPAHQTPGKPGPQKDDTPFDPTNLVTAATRRGASQAGEQAGEQGTAQAVSQVTQQAGQQGTTQAVQQAASQGLPKQPPSTSWSGQITNAPDPAVPNSNNALTMAQLVQHVYDPSQALPSGWSQVSSSLVEQWTGINPDSVASGLHVGVFTNGSGQYVEALAGAQNPLDDAVVVVEETGGNPVQYQDAVQVGAGLVNQFGAANVAMTGHSMGGGEAAASALQNGTSAITFEAQGLSPGYLQSVGIDPSEAFAQAADGQIQHYFIQGEFATLIQREIPFVNGLPNAPGLNYALPWVTNDAETGAMNIAAVGPPGDAHNIAPIISALQQTTVPPQLMFTQPIPGEAATEGLVNFFAPLFVEPIANAVLGGMSTPPAP
ncbi:hypothetical protein [Mycobacteroides franklinii]|uniref:Extracellular phospholipase A1 n=1 Tax=Mycobacteroides franklinii TaxID=948102 RepID=A0A4R8RBQ9_9MYCO|nr:hypothetical protein [Mycobacteroides franklinii]TDZ41036.1 Extracellular phospholipase A1 precursor [Mycobacteroides franklinii]TDZ53842.1 Extracellular phospholipase A1 precursor [Mycobacteroides franklinii]TDZ54379.1 Extracellular phospholipase A1 precursor [Mycobacteroides franklinii]TDZ61012.1 Extracellular phospholipase A1 precursor [Mycobacteroides franklinii]TDZ67700.1 Extracellular phospholipase A1 precursor [Mycobacteroides franklinii]